MPKGNAVSGLRRRFTRRTVMAISAVAAVVPLLAGTTMPASAASKPVPFAATPTPAGNEPGVPGEYYWAGIQQPAPGGQASGVGGDVGIDNPVLTEQTDQVTNEISIVSGANTSLVEVGYRKFDSAEPTLMLSHWVNNTFLDASGFVYTQSTYQAGMSLQSFVGQTVPIYIEHSQGNWWVSFNNTWLGYFPDSLWNGGFTTGDTGNWYGEVYSASNNVPPKTQMGNGLPGANTSAEAINNMCLYDANGNCNLISNAVQIQTAPSYYTLHYDGQASQRHGGPGQ